MKWNYPYPYRWVTVCEVLAIIWFLCNEGESATKIRHRLYAMYGDNVMPECTFWNGFVAFVLKDGQTFMTKNLKQNRTWRQQRGGKESSKKISVQLQMKWKKFYRVNTAFRFCARLFNTLSRSSVLVKCVHAECLVYWQTRTERQGWGPFSCSSVATTRIRPYCFVLWQVTKHGFTMQQCLQKIKRWYGNAPMNQRQKKQKLKSRRRS